MALLGGKKSKLWIWKAYHRDTGKLVDWECGHRDERTGGELITRLEWWDVETYCTDHYPIYNTLISADKLVQTKKQTHRIESNNGRQRDYFARFKRKTKAVSRSLEMVNLTSALFATFHVNGTIDNLLALVR